MTRKVILILITCLVLVAVWLVFMGVLNSRVATVNVQVSGGVDELSIYNQSNPSQAVATIRTNGQDTTQTVQLPRTQRFSLLFQSPPAHYYFVMRAGGHSYQSTPICCTVGLSREQRSLIIRALGDWEVSGG
jgi:hypothetical protein